MALSVIGVGFGRTGTFSLKLALEQLGFGPCCHGSDERHFRQGAKFWQRVFNHEPIDWDEFFTGYRSTVDSPSCRFYWELAEKYPQARLVLTVRDADSWFSSYEETLLPMIASSQGEQFCRFLFGEGRPDRAAAIRAFQRHNTEVRMRIPAHRLLVYEVGQGWAPLCKFLRVPIPETPFPHSNLRKEFPEVVEGMLARL